MRVEQFLCSEYVSKFLENNITSDEIVTRLLFHVDDVEQRLTTTYARCCVRL